MPTLSYRFRVRAADDLSDALLVTTGRGGVAPYMAAAPHGDGQEIDVITGRVMFGSYTVIIADAHLGGGVRVVTSELADSAGRPHLLGRKAYIESSPDGATWTVRVIGYVEGIRFPDAITAEFTIGDSLRIDRTYQIFRKVSRETDPNPDFIIGTSIVPKGGPIRGGWAGFPDRQGPLRMKVGSVSGTDVRLDPAAGPIGNDTFLPIARKARRYLDENDGRGRYPDLIVRTKAVSGGAVLEHTPFSGEPLLYNGVASPAFFVGGRIFVEWNGSLPAVNALFDVYVTPIPISEENPGHVYAHPIDALTALWTEAEIPWDSTAAAAVRTALGDSLRQLWRPIGPETLSDWQEKEIFGFHGVGFETAPDGERELFLTRMRDSALPSGTITGAEMLSLDPVLWEIDESSMVDRVVISHPRFSEWTQRPADVPADESWPTRPPDGIVSDRDTDIYDYEFATGRGREVVYELSGMLTTTAAAKASKIRPTITAASITAAVAREIIDRFATGCASGELIVKETVAALLGRDITLTIPHQINGIVRGGSRIVQIVRKTVMDGPLELKWLDRGVSGQATTVPTFTLVAGTTEPKRFVKVTLTNAAALAALGYRVRFEWGFGGSAPAGGALLADIDPATTTIINPPRVDSGARVWVRARAQDPTGLRPTAFSAWQDIDLADLTAPFGLSHVGSNVVEWTPGEGPQEILWRPASEATDRSLGLLAAGSNRYDLTPVADAGVSIVVTVRSRDEPPYAGVSSSVTVTFTTSSAPSLNAPTILNVGRLGFDDDELLWDDPSNPPGSSVHIERSIVSGVSGFLELEVYPDDDTQTRIEAAAGTSDTWYRVRYSYLGVYSAYSPVAHLAL